MIPWPETAHGRAVAEPEPVEAPSPGTPDASDPSVEIDTRPPETDAAPALPPMPPKRAVPQGKARIAPLSLAGALVFSAAVHAAVIALLSDHITRPGVEALTDPISVEIVLEEPAAPVAGSAGTALARAAKLQLEAATAEKAEPEPAQKAEEEKAQDADEPLEVAKEAEASRTAPREQPPEETATAAVEEPLPANEEALPAEEATPPVEPSSPANMEETEGTPLAESTVEPTNSGPAEKSPANLSQETETATPKTPEAPPAEPAVAKEAAEPATPEERHEPEQAEPEEQPEAVASVILPQENIPIPTPRPQPPRAKRAETKQEPQNRPARMAPATPRQTARAQETPPAAKESPARQSAASSAARQGGATAGEKAAYARRLIAHVERHKRYPRDAARQGIAGTTGLAITIDRQGRLAGASLARRSGHAILDEEALAVARRAAPYPRPPEGVGGATVTFSVTLRFSP